MKRNSNRIRLIGILLVIIMAPNLLYSKGDRNIFSVYPKPYDKWNYSFLTGISVAKLPVIISENEVSHAPLLWLDFRMGLPYDISSGIELKSNYISNLAAISFGWTFSLHPFCFQVGGKVSGWYGQLSMDSEKFSSLGWILSPFIKSGMQFNEIYATLSLETLHSRYYTYSENEFLGIVRDPRAGIAVQLSVEQPLWHDNYVLLGVKFTYSKFFYQSWLSYSTIDDYLIYPEIMFGFIL
jgi:hypothetical protein